MASGGFSPKTRSELSGKKSSLWLCTNCYVDDINSCNLCQEPINQKLRLLAAQLIASEQVAHLPPWLR